MMLRETGGHVEPERNALAAELLALKRGRGVPGLRTAGPELRALCGVLETDVGGLVRQKVAATLGKCIEPLPPDQALAAAAALGLHPDARHKFLRERVEWLARQLDRDPRTIRRYVDDALVALAQLPSPRDPAPGRPPEQGWDLRELSTLLRLDRPTPESVETRTVVANVDGLEQLEALVTVPRDATRRAGDHNLELEILYGVRIAGAVRETATRFRYALQLPRPLARGETHEYAMIVRVPPGQPMLPHYVFNTPHRCDRFDLRVRFDAERVPAQVWAVAEAYPRDFDTDGPEDQPYEPDALGELHLRFEQLQRGLGYGARWSRSPSYAIRLDDPT
jgi:hypothetical protein